MKKNPVKKLTPAHTCKTGKRKPGHPPDWTEAKLHELGRALIESCNGPDVFHIVDFCRAVDKSTAWFYEMSRKYPIFAEYHEKAKGILGNKILKLAIKAGNPWAIKTMIPKYLHDVDEYIDEKKRKEIEWQAEFKRLAETEVDSKADKLIAAIEQAVNASSEQEAD